jgi:hypothetical protein
MVVTVSTGADTGNAALVIGNLLRRPPERAMIPTIACSCTVAPDNGLIGCSRIEAPRERYKRRSVRTCPGHGLGNIARSNNDRPPAKQALLP